MTSYCGGVGDSDLLELQCLLVVDVPDYIGSWALRWMTLGGRLGAEFVPEGKVVWTIPSYSK